MQGAAAVDHGGQAVVEGEDLPGVANQGLARLGQAGRPFGAVEQPDAVGVLQHLDLHADGGMGEAERIGRGGEGALILDRDQTF